MGRARKTISAFLAVTGLEILSELGSDFFGRQRLEGGGDYFVVSLDGQRFLMLRFVDEEGTAPAPIVVLIQNVFELLR